MPPEWWPNQDPGWWGVFGAYMGFLALLVQMLWPTGHICHDPRCKKDSWKD